MQLYDSKPSGRPVHASGSTITSRNTGHMEPNNATPNCPFDVLNFAQVPKDLDLDTLKRHRRDAMLLWHPDKRGPNQSAAETAYANEKAAAINEAFESLKATLPPVHSGSRASGARDAVPPGGGQQGRGGAPRNGDYRLRTSRFGSTISALREGELSLQMVLDHVHSVVGGFKRGGEPMRMKAFGVGLEKHKEPAHPAYEWHVHWMLEVESGRLDCSSKCFDLKGTSGQTLRNHITQFETDEHFFNWINYVLKQGRALIDFPEDYMTAAASKKRPRYEEADHNDQPVKEAETWHQRLEAALETEATPEDAVLTLRTGFFKEFVLHYDKMLKAAVIARIYD